ncbi:MAG: hypothetical protein KAQ75_06985, partial [Bacteroidales bacterium]|nr:hypothetical protein [Bacteroidales bacterium]
MPLSIEQILIKRIKSIVIISLFFLISLLFLFSCSVPVFYKVNPKNIKLSGELLPLPIKIILDNYDTIYKDNMEYSLTGDFIRDKWKVHTKPIQISIATNLSKEINRTIELAFDKKYLSIEQKDNQKYILKLSFRIINQHTNHKTNFSGTRRNNKEVPQNIYESRIIGELQYELLSPNEKLIIYGHTTGAGSGKGKQVGLIFSGDTGYKDAFIGSLNAALS